MLLGLATKIFGSSNERVLKKLQPHVEAINALEQHYESMNDSELRAQTNEFRQKLLNGASLDDILHDAFAVVREASKRTLGLRHFDVQLVGGLILNQGKIAEMKTGEGKTLVATLPAYLNAIEGKGAHVVTVNDYLAKRDTEWMGQVYNFLGLSTGCILSSIPDAERKNAYAADITYGTNNEFGFDYLRDNMKYRLSDMAQRDFNFAIVDEVDSILIDEARTPLIISGPSETATELYVEVDKIIPHLDNADYDLDEKLKNVTFTDQGTEHVEELLKQQGTLEEGGLYDAQNIAIVHHINQALRAHKLFTRDTDYIIKDGKVVIIDEFTGRMMEGRRFSEGLHQALEAKEHVSIQSENQTLASITFQNYFRLYPKLAGMTGTAMTEAGEFAEIYNLGVVEVPPNVPVTRIDHDDKIYKSLREKEDSIVKIIKKAQEKNQPVLVGTVSIEKSEKLSESLNKLKIKHSVLNARHHEQESHIIAQAGRPGAVTIATNMAGRGTDIQLGGNLAMRIEQEVDPNWDKEKKERAIETIKAEIERDKQLVKDAGGLLIIGTERHESRRIDNQLRGRAGRQGDPGETMFFLSVEDDLMRIFSPEALEAVLGNKKMGLREGESLTHPWLSKALEKAQGRVEQQHFEVRKTLLKFDNVMNDQRKVIYEQRREIMDAENVEELVRDMRHTVIEELVSSCIPHNAYAEQWDIETLDTETTRLLGLDLPIEDWSKEEGIADAEMLDRILDASDKKMAEKAANTGPQAWRAIEKSFMLQILDQHWKEHLLNLDHLKQGINLRAFGQRDPLNEFKTESFTMFEDMLAALREGVVQNLSLIEINLDEERLARFLAAHQELDEEEQQTSRSDPALMGMGQADRDHATREQGAGQVHPFPQQSKKPFNENDPSTWGKIGRNAPCPCGSGKKFKHCHGKI